jgi:antitoxin StbD
MERIHSALSVSISEFKQNSGKWIEEAHSEPVAVLNHNRPPSELTAEMAEFYGERQLATLVRSRMKSVKRAVKVNIDEL